MARIGRFLARPRNEQVLLVVASSLFVVFFLLVRFSSVARCEQVARTLARRGAARWPVVQVDWALSVVERNRPGSGGCLPAALVGLAITDEEALALQLGVRYEDGELDAHAWLETPDGNRLYAGADPEEYHRLS